MIQNADPGHKRLYERTLKAYIIALRSYDAGVPYQYGGLNPLPGCPQFTSVAPPTGTAAPAASAGARPSASGGGPAPPATAASTAHARTVELLKKRQAELRAAAAQAKGRGDMAAAREFLRSSLGMNNMIKAAAAGLPVDLKQLPPAPGAGRGGGASGVAHSAQQPILSGQAADPPVEFQTALMSAGQSKSAF